MAVEQKSEDSASVDQRKHPERSSANPRKHPEQSGVETRKHPERSSAAVWRCAVEGRLRAPARRGVGLTIAAVAGLLCLALALIPLASATVAAAAPGAAAAPLLTATITPIPGTGSVTGVVWDDADGNGIRDAGEAPLPGAVARAQNLDSGAVWTGVSDATGVYYIAGLAPAAYRIDATPPGAYTLTTQGSFDVGLAAGAVVALDFGARLLPTPTPTATTPPLLDVSNAERLYCGGVYAGDNFAKANNVSSYACRPWWDESGGEVAYRLELDASQPVTVTLLNATADFDLFLLRFVYPDSCLAAGDNYFTYNGQPGVFYLAVDGYRGATGSYSFRVDCPADQQATPTPTFTPSPTPTATATGSATPTVSAAPPAARLYLPLVMRSTIGGGGPPVTITLQDGLNGYTGTTDTTLDSWEPQTPQGDDNRLRLFYSQPPKITTQMAPALRFDLTLLPLSAQVQSARLRLYLPSTPPYDLRAAAQGLLRPWDEATATWDVAWSGQPWDEPGATGPLDRTVWSSEFQRISEGARWYEFDVTPLAKSWANQPQSNYGMVLSAAAGDAAANVQALFTSSEGNGLFRPQLIVSYALPAP